MGQYIVERNVKVEIIDEVHGDAHESGFCIGSGRTGGPLPNFTDEELKAGLGEGYYEIERAFANLGRAMIEAKQATELDT